MRTNLPISTEHCVLFLFARLRRGQDEPVARNDIRIYLDERWFRRTRLWVGRGSIVFPECKPVLRCAKRFIPGRNMRRAGCQHPLLAWRRHLIFEMFGLFKCASHILPLHILLPLFSIFVTHVRRCPLDWHHCLFKHRVQPLRVDIKLQRQVAKRGGSVCNHGLGGCAVREAVV